MGTRAESLINQPVTLGFRHLYNGYLMDAHQLLGVRILNQNDAQVAFIPPEDITRIDLGIYSAVAPGELFSTPGTYHDVWEIVPTEGSAQRNLRFDINVVILSSQPAMNFNQLFATTIADLDATLLKRKYLWPVWTVLSNGYYLSDYVLQSAIDTAITKFQRLLGVPLRHMRVITRPFAAEQTPPNPVKGIDYDEDGRLIQWSVHGSEAWSSIRLPHSGIIRVRGLRGVYGGQIVYNIPTAWIDRNEFAMGVLHVRPTSAGAVSNMIDGAGRFLDVTLLEGVGANTVPGFWAVDYDYGQENGEIPLEVGDVVMKQAAVQILDQLGMAITQGIASRSASVDGLSSSVGFVANAERSMFGALAARYEQDLQEANIMDLRRFMKGPSIFIL